MLLCFRFSVVRIWVLHWDLSWFTSRDLFSLYQMDSGADGGWNSLSRTLWQSEQRGSNWWPSSSRGVSDQCIKVAVKQILTIDDHRDGEFLRNGPSFDPALTHVRPSIISLHLGDKQWVITQLTDPISPCVIKDRERETKNRYRDRRMERERERGHTRTKLFLCVGLLVK